MSLYEIKLDGVVRPKKNSKRIVNIKGRRMVISSKQYMEWHKNAMQQLENTKIPKDNIDYPIAVSMIFYRPDARKRDLSNMVESINDLLVDYGFFADDNCDIIKSLHIYDGGIDRDRPRCKVIISEAKEDYEL